MVQRLLHGDGGKLGFRRLQEWTARCGQPDVADLLHSSPTQALVDRIVLAVNWKKRLPLLSSFGGNQFARDHQAFLVGQTDGLPGAYGFIGGLQPRHAHDRADHEIYFGMCGHTDRSSRAVYDFDVFDSCGFQLRPQNLRVPFGGN